MQQEAPDWQPPSTASGSKKKTGAAAVKSEPGTVTASKSHKKRKVRASLRDDGVDVAGNG